MSKAFKDKNQQSWTIDLTVGLVLRITDTTKFNLLDSASASVPGDPNSNIAATLASDLREFWELLWYVIEDEASERGVNAEDFGKLMPPGALIDARVAFFAEWRDFFLQLQKPELELIVAKAEEFQAMAAQKMKEHLRHPSLKLLTQKIDDHMSTALNNSFGPMLESLESTLGGSPGGK